MEGVRDHGKASGHGTQDGYGGEWVPGVTKSGFVGAWGLGGGVADGSGNWHDNGAGCYGDSWFGSDSLFVYLDHFCANNGAGIADGRGDRGACSGHG